jgi:hypothetical protein
MKDYYGEKPEPSASDYERWEEEAIRYLRQVVESPEDVDLKRLKDALWDTMEGGPLYSIESEAEDTRKALLEFLRGEVAGHSQNVTKAVELIDEYIQERK